MLTREYGRASAECPDVSARPAYHRSRGALDLYHGLPRNCLRTWPRAAKTVAGLASSFPAHSHPLQPGGTLRVQAVCPAGEVLRVGAGVDVITGDGCVWDASTGGACGPASVTSCPWINLDHGVLAIDLSVIGLRGIVRQPADRLGRDPHAVHPQLPYRLDACTGR